MSDRPTWFARKRYGLGAGRPIAWQGWALIALFIASFMLAYWLFGPEDPRGLAIIIPAVVGLLVISALTTRGGWRWRWGDNK